MVTTSLFPADVIAHFESKVDRDPEIEGGCHLWTAGHFMNGYGCFLALGRSVPTSRFAWQAFVGEIPSCAKVIHSCGDRSCVNTDHLSLRLAKPLMDRVMEKVDRSQWIPGGCWIWMASKNELGYGRVSFNSKSAAAYRVVYEMFRGAVPTGLELDHLCRVHSCVNPDHLEAVTHQVNMSRGSCATKTHCKHGHEFTIKNTYIRPDTGHRMCKQCGRDRQRRIDCEVDGRG